MKRGTKWADGTTGREAAAAGWASNTGAATAVASKTGVGAGTATGATGWSGSAIGAAATTGSAASTDFDSLENVLGIIFNIVIENNYATLGLDNPDKPWIIKCLGFSMAVATDGFYGFQFHTSRLKILLRM